MKLAAFPAGTAFLPALAKAWLAEPDEPGEGLIILPNRRAARALAAAFVPANGGRALLLPRIIAPGAIDEAGLTLAGGLALPPAIPALARQAILARLILALNGRNGAPRKLPAALALAADLGHLLDEADTAGIDLAAALPNVVTGELAAHWHTTLRFLEIVTHRWPEILRGLGLLNPAARQSALLDAQAKAWAAAPPTQRIWLVSAGGSPAMMRLAAVVAALPRGVVLLSGYDASLPELAWERLEDSHPMAGIARLLAALGAKREEVASWPALPHALPHGRQRLISSALLPAERLESWQGQPTFDLTGLSRLSARDEQTEAMAIALLLRDALEKPGATAALITPDRALATRVAVALKRFGIIADDSAGEPLNSAPPAVFLRLLAAAAISEFAPLPLLALLKHPLAAAGEAPEAARAQVRALELLLRGPRPSPGFDGIKFLLDEHGNARLREFVDRLEWLLRPLVFPLNISPAQALRRLIAGAEALAETAEAPGASVLWRGEAGAALADLLAEAMVVLDDHAAIPPADLPDLLDALLDGKVIRRPRARDNHPRIAIWGIQEAALQTVDVAVLGGLTEGVWPAVPEPGPWLSRPMRNAVGLPAPEQEIGAAAHQFFALCCACREIVLSAPLRRERSPAVPARWLTRLDALLAATGQSLPPHPAQAWAEQLDLPQSRSLRQKPRPVPPAVLRPRNYSISDITMLMADPYAIYAKYVLRLRELAPLDEESDANLFGDIVHEGLAEFYGQGPDFCARDAAPELAHSLAIAMRRKRPRAALEHWWEARLARIAGWVVEAERERRPTGMAPAVAVERAGQLEYGPFTLKGRADRIEKWADGSLSIVDYKTGAPPSVGDVESGRKPQLVLEAVLAEQGAFGADMQGEVTELAFWKLTGRDGNGEIRVLFARQPEKLREIIQAAEKGLVALLEKFARPATPYLARPHPGRGLYYDPYAGVSRRGEWGGDGNDAA